MKIRSPLRLLCCTLLLSSPAGLAAAGPEISHQAEFSATSYFGALNPNSRKHKSVMKINQSRARVRYSYPERKKQAINIFRYDKGLIWNVHPEKKFYPGVKLYQEFELKSERGFNSHLDALAQAKSELKDTKNLETIGAETIEGIETTHYRRRIPSPYEKGKFYTSDFWMSDDGILVKMTYQATAVSGQYELKDIEIGPQDDALFEPPPDYEKRGHRISWKEEKQKLEASEQKGR